MDSFEFNKLAGGVLAAATVLLGVSIATDLAYRITPPAKKAYVVEGVVEEAAAAAPAVAEKPIAFYLASASAEKGEAVFKKCGACHNNDKGGANGIGPNLYGIVGKSHANAEGFAYSADIAGMKGKPWNWDDLNKWLTSPKAYAPGTKMAFAGIGKPEDRASLLLYLNAKSDAPLPLPAAPAAEAAPAADAAAAADANAAPAAEAAPAK